MMNSPSNGPWKIFARFRYWLETRQKEKQLIEHTVETVEPKIRLARGYRKQLKKPIQICLAHCVSLVANIPGPIYLKDSDYDADPLIHAAFLGSVRLKDLIKSQDVGLKSQLPMEPERYALLSMAHRESTVFAPKMQGNMILSDAQMKSITFTDHKIVGLSTSLEYAKKKLENVCFQMILEAISREIAARRTNLLELRQHIERLRAMSEIFSGEDLAPDVFGHSSHNNIEKLKKVEQMLKDSEDELVHAREDNDSPEDWLEILINHLASPEKVMNVQRISMRLDWRNVRTEGSDEKANDIILAQCVLADEMKRDAVFIRYKNNRYIDP